MIPTALPDAAFPVAAIGFNRDLLDMIRHAGWLAWLVLALLSLESVLSWAVMLYKWRQMKRLAAEDGRFHEAFRRSKSLKEAHAASARYEASSLSAVYRAGYTELARQGGGHAEASAPAAFRIYLRPLERSMRRAERLEHEKHRKRLGVLATVASSAPFIGLFGTVWGILNAFHKIGLEGSANVAAVAPGISEALIATAAGLAAAIPAVLGYNYFVALARGRASDMEAFVLECMTLIENAALREGNLGD